VEGIGAAQLPGRLVLVTNSIYGVGMTEANGRSRVVLDDRVVVRGVNGPEVTVIEGQQEDPQAGQQGVRCADVRDGSVLSGFTLTGGAAGEGEGGGAYCEPAGVLTNCMIRGNSATQGGGVQFGTLYDCTLSGNSADLGGGAAGQAVWMLPNTPCVLYSCTLTGNRAGRGGGSHASTLYNCLLTGNSARESGGGASASTLFNCTVVANSAESSGGGLAPRSAIGYCWNYNSIVYFNHAPREPNYRLIDGKTSILRFEHCCTSPLPEGLGNITADPRFVDAGAGDFRLRADSPCLNAGFNGYPVGATDLDGRPRIVASTVGTNTFTDTNAVAVPGAFYRVGVEE